VSHALDTADFLRLFPVRGPNVQWLLGAGASAAAGIPTAYDLVWQFKRAIYCAAQKVPIRACADLGDPALRARIQQYFDSIGGYPPYDGGDEYAHYFEAAYPSETDRRVVIERAVAGARPSYGHIALAVLMAAGYTHGVWTTNFDRMVEDAAASVLGTTGRLVVATPDNADVAMQALNQGRWPLLGKLHGDFQSQRLKNTSAELRTQDQRLRRALIEAGRRFGLAIVGYSGRDESVLEALRQAIDGGNGYPSGLFWFNRGGRPPLPAVAALIDEARTRGIDAHLIPFDTFDELLADIAHQIPDLAHPLVERLDRHVERVTNAPVPSPGRGWPLLRMNALPVEGPSMCRRIVCSVGGTGEVREAIRAAGVDVLAARTRQGVIAFGDDNDVRAAFSAFDVTDFGFYPIEARRLRYESADLGLLYEALARALARERPLRLERRRNQFRLVVDPTRGGDLSPLRNAVGAALTGTIPGTKLGWAEAIRLTLDFKLERLWLVIEPTVWTDDAPTPESGEAAREFVRSRLPARYNPLWNRLLEGWASLLVGPRGETTVQALGVTTGVDAAFTLVGTTGFSRGGGVH
jgi:hypothetical protein